VQVTSEAGGGGARVPLTKREREILGLLAEGLSGAQIAGELVLSPETVRTHVRNAMTKLGASTRSQAVALALRGNEISTENFATASPERAPAPPPPPRPTGDPTAGLATMLERLVSLYDVDGGGVYLAESDGLSLSRVATAASGESGRELADVVALGDGPLGRAALERRAQLVHDTGPSSSSSSALIAAPMVGGGRLLGVIALRPRPSRPIGRSEMLLLQAFANRVAEIVLDGSDVDDRLATAMDRFSTSWSAGPRLA
jgi:DNA-binding CsgD family transcriptional regulator